MLERSLAVLAAAATLFGNSMTTALPGQNLQGNTYIVNRSQSLDDAYEPEVRKLNVSGKGQSMRDEAAKALEDMFEAAKADGILLDVVSGYRSFSKQATIYQRKLRTVGSAEKADLLVARAGTSEHQLGLAADLARRGTSSLNASFAGTKEGKWVYEHCYEFGFIVRYLEGYEDITGYSFEPWHVRYVGPELARSVSISSVPYELYLSSYQKEVFEFLITEACEARP